MDPIKGADMLSRRLGETVGPSEAVAVPSIGPGEGALPLYHWVGICPPVRNGGELAEVADTSSGDSPAQGWLGLLRPVFGALRR